MYFYHYIRGNTMLFKRESYLSAQAARWCCARTAVGADSAGRGSFWGRAVERGTGPAGTRAGHPKLKLLVGRSENAREQRRRDATRGLDA